MNPVIYRGKIRPIQVIKSGENNEILLKMFDQSGTLAGYSQFSRDRDVNLFATDGKESVIGLTGTAD